MKTFCGCMSTKSGTLTIIGLGIVSSLDSPSAELLQYDSSLRENNMPWRCEFLQLKTSSLNSIDSTQSFYKEHFF